MWKLTYEEEAISVEIKFTSLLQEENSSVFLVCYPDCPSSAFRSVPMLVVCQVVRVKQKMYGEKKEKHGRCVMLILAAVETLLTWNVNTRGKL